MGIPSIPLDLFGGRGRVPRGNFAKKLARGLVSVTAPETVKYRDNRTVDCRAHAQRRRRWRPTRSRPRWPAPCWICHARSAFTRRRGRRSSRGSGATAAGSRARRALRGAAGGRGRAHGGPQPGGRAGGCEERLRRRVDMRPRTIEQPDNWAIEHRADAPGFGEKTEVGICAGRDGRVWRWHGDLTNLRENP